MLRAFSGLGLLLLTALGCASASVGDRGTGLGTAGTSTSDCCPAIPAGNAGSEETDEDGGTSGVLAPSECSGLLWREADATAMAAETLVATATELTQRVSVACGSLHEELTRETGDAAAPGASVTELCAAAAQALRSVGGTTPVVAIEGGQCSIAAPDQVSCEMSCSGGCSPGSPEARCGTENQYALCAGTCASGAACQGSIETPAPCVGECKGACTGSCSGTCASLVNSNAGPTTGVDDCEGYCDGECDGLCTGECVLASSSSQSCGSEAPCHGACSESIDAIGCVWPLAFEANTECHVGATCYGACAGMVALAPHCVPPTVHVIGGFAASVGTALEAYLAPLFRAAGGDGRLAADAAPGVVEAAASVKSSLDANPICMAEVGVENIGALVDASAARAAIEEAVGAAALVVEEALGEEQSDSIL